MDNWYGLENQTVSGKQMWQVVQSQSKIIDDPVISEYMNRLGQIIVRNSDTQPPFTIKLINSNDLNAFTLAGGFFNLNSGLIRVAHREAELAGVMAHEIAHAGHATRRDKMGVRT
jgi:predicted Zn-dependent protease